MKDKVMTIYDHIRSSLEVDPWTIAEHQKELEAYLTDGCAGCAFASVEEWEMPCAKCRRNAKDYWRKEVEGE